MRPRTSKAWEGCYFLNTCLNWTSEESIGIYAKNGCQWNGHLMKFEFGQQIYVGLKLVGSLDPFLAAKAWEDGWSFKVECA